MPKQVKECQHCHKEFTPKANPGRARFCSRECGNLDRRTLVPQDCVTCGVSFTSKNQGAKFCSRACYVIDGIPGRPMGETVTFVCLGCGNDHTVPKSYPSAKKYCSNACAKKERKHGWSKAGLLLEDGGVVIFRSMYELRFVAVCERFRVPWRSYDGPDIITSLGIYRPDFIITNNNQEYVVEIKGWMDQESATKVEEASANNPFFVLIDKTELLEIEQSGMVAVDGAKTW